jgi:hypothetical protein
MGNPIGWTFTRTIIVLLVLHVLLLFISFLVLLLFILGLRRAILIEKGKDIWRIWYSR